MIALGPVIVSFASLQCHIFTALQIILTFRISNYECYSTNSSSTKRNMSESNLNGNTILIICSRFLYLCLFGHSFKVRNCFHDKDSAMHTNSTNNKYIKKAQEYFEKPQFFQCTQIIFYPWIKI